MDGKGTNIFKGNRILLWKFRAFKVSLHTSGSGNLSVSFPEIFRNEPTFCWMTKLISWIKRTWGPDGRKINFSVENRPSYLSIILVRVTTFHWKKKIDIKVNGSSNNGLLYFQNLICALWMVAKNVLANFLSCNDVKKFYKFEEISESTCYCGLVNGDAETESK